MKRRAIFLDRDGVLNHAIIKNGKPYPPANVHELTIPGDVQSALYRLKSLGFMLIGATNQPDVARGQTQKSTVEAINAKLMTELPLDDILVCYHDDVDACDCRKPSPGLLTQAAEKYDIDLTASFMVGDRWKDIAAGQQAGCKTIWINNHYQEKGPEQLPDLTASCLSEAADWICGIIKESIKMRKVEELKIKLFADGADKKGMLEMYQNPLIKGFTTNPTLMRKAGVTNYQAFALDILQTIKDRSISFEVFADDFAEMEEQAHEIASWGENVMVKIPVTNTQKQFAGPLIKRLSAAGIPLNITAILTLHQVQAVADCLAEQTPSIVSVFAGRVADTGIDPMPMMKQALSLLKNRPRAELLWASPRELLNVFQADEVGCHIITATNDVLNKLTLVGKDLEEYSLETVKMFYRDAQAAGYEIKVVEPA